MNIPENFDRWMFDYLEGNLSETERGRFEDFLAQNPSLEVDSDAWNNAFIADEPVAYPNEKALLRKKRVAAWYAWPAAAMATAVLGIGVWLGVAPTPSLNLKNNTTAQLNSPERNTPTALNQLTVSQTAPQLTNGNAPSTNAPVVTPSSVSGNNYVSTSASTSFITNAPNIRSVDISALIRNQTAPTSIPNYGETLTLDQSIINADELSHFEKAVEQEKAKLTDDEYQSQYLANPDEVAIEVDTKRKSTVNYSSFSNKLKRFYTKIERRMGYPVGLINLRDPDLMIPENDLLAFNPGFAGGMLRSRFEVNYRNQWSGTNQNSQQMTMRYDDYIHGIRGGIGVMVNATDFGGGALGDYSIDLVYSPKIFIAKNVVFEPAVKVSLGMLTNNANRIGFNQQFELNRGQILRSATTEQMAVKNDLWYKDYGAGFVLNTKWFYGGFSADNLAQHYANVYTFENEAEPTRSPILYTAVIGADYESDNRNMTFSPFVSYRKFGQNEEFWGGLNYRLNKFTIGGGYSSNNDYTVSVGLKYDKFKLVYHYDRTRNTVLDGQFGSHNIGIRFNGNKKNARFKR